MSSNNSTLPIEGEVVTTTTLPDGQVESTTSSASQGTTTLIHESSGPSDIGNIWSKFESLSSSSSSSTGSSPLSISIVTPSYSQLENSFSAFSSSYGESTILIMNNGTTTLSRSPVYSESQRVRTADYSNSTLISTSASVPYSDQYSSTYYALATSTVTSTDVLPSSLTTISPETTSATSTVTPTSTSSTSSDTTLGSITYTYDQLYYITDTSTSFTTDMTITRTFPAYESFSPATDEPITTNMSFYIANFVDVKHVSGTDGIDGSKKSTIIGSVVGSILGFGLVLFLLWFLFFKKRKAKQDSNEMGFSHSIASTRINRYNSTDSSYGRDAQYFGAVMDYPQRPPPLNHTNSNTSIGSDEHGLKSLRNSILQDQQMEDATHYNCQYYNSQPEDQSHRTQLPNDLERNMGIETVLEENESDRSSINTARPTVQSDPISHYSKAINSSRYKNAGLQLNNTDLASPPVRHINIHSSPFDDPITVRRNAPTPPPSRKSTQHQAQSGTSDENRKSVDSSIISDDTDISSDDSILQFDGTLGNGNGENRGGFFREIV